MTFQHEESAAMAANDFRSASINGIMLKCKQSAYYPKANRGQQRRIGHF